ncbi:MAG: glycosyltransferase [Bdellovibrionales bacterium]
MPAISVLMSVYNGERFLDKAIDSILKQTFKDFEFIIINDGSTDKSSKMLQTYAKQDPRIILIEQENKGLIAALNKGIDCAKTPLIARMDADDIALPERLALQKTYLDENLEVIALGGAIEIIDENDSVFEKVEYPISADIEDYIFNRGSPLAHPAVMMRTQKVKELGGYRYAYKHAEDYDLWLRMHKIGTIDNIKQTILKYREHTNKISVQNARAQAVTSVVARYAAKADKDPTTNLEIISEDTLKLFEPNKQNRMQWEIIDIICSGLLLSPSDKAMLKIKELLPTQISPEAKPIVVRVFLKLAKVVAKTNRIDKALILSLRAFLTSPKHTLALFSEKLLK